MNDDTTDEDTFDNRFYSSYYDIHKDNKALNNALNKAFRGSKSDIADLFRLLGDSVFGVSGNFKNFTWYHFDKKRWVIGVEPAIQFCLNEVSNTLLECVKWFIDSDLSSDIIIDAVTSIKRIVGKIRKDTFCKSILADAAITINDVEPDFEQKLDTNKDVINFDGQLYNLVDGTSRACTAKDFVSKTTGYKLPAVDAETQTNILTLLSTMFETKAGVDYFLLWLASCLDGHNTHNYLHVLSGYNNSDEVSQILLLQSLEIYQIECLYEYILVVFLHQAVNICTYLISAVFGKDCKESYFVNGTIRYLEDALNINRIDWEHTCLCNYLDLRGKRFVAVCELEVKRTLSQDLVKACTNGYPLKSHYQWDAFDPQHSIAYISNKNPLTEFRTKIKSICFAYNCKPKPSDYSKEKLYEYAPQLMLIILEFHKKYIRPRYSVDQIFRQRRAN